MAETQDFGELALELQAVPDAADVRTIGQGVHDVLGAEVGSRRREPFALILRDRDGAVVGGIVGKVLFGDLHIDQIWLREDLRGRGYGRALMAEAEAHAGREGCGSIVLNTMSPGVREFYQRSEYHEIGRIEDFPVGHTVYFLRKEL